MGLRICSRAALSVATTRCQSILSSSSIIPHTTDDSGLSPTAAVGAENGGRSNHGVAGVGPSATPFLPSRMLVLCWRTSHGCNSRREPSTRRESKSKGREGKTVGAMVSKTHSNQPIFKHLPFPALFLCKQCWKSAFGRMMASDHHPHRLTTNGP